MTRRPRADEGYEYEDPLPDPLVGGAPDRAPAAEDLAAELLDLAGQLARIHLQLAEADQDEWRRIGPRLDAVRRLAANLPATPKHRPALGFAAPAPKARRKKARRRD